MYKMMVIDIDDTLINDNQCVSPATKAALEAAAAEGVTITLATGRMFPSAEPVARQLNLNVPISTYQGSIIKNLLDEKILYERYVPLPIAQFLYEYAMKHRLHLQAYHQDQLYVREDNQKVRDYGNPYIIEPDFHKVIERPSVKYLFIDEPDVLDAIAADLRQQLADQAHITKSKPCFLEVLHKQGTKGHAVQFLAQHYGIKRSEIIAIGDSWNDREMLQLAGLGVAMGNAVDSLKEIADYVTLSNNEDGVKHVIDKFILK